MGIAWRQALDARNERFGRMADHFGVDLDLVASGSSAAEFRKALGRCLTCERQAECESWQEFPVSERRTAPDFCPNSYFFGVHSTWSSSTPTEPPRSRVIRFLDYVDDLLTCVASTERRRWPPGSALRGIGIDPTGSWGPLDDRCNDPPARHADNPGRTTH